jgi:hypothetical protein
MDCRDAAYQAGREDETLSGCVFRHLAPVFAESELATECPLPTSWSSTGCFSSMPSMPQEVDESTNNLSPPTPWQDKHLGRHREPKLPICDCTIEPSIRFRKQYLHWILPRFRTAARCDRWTMLVSLAQWQLFLGRDLVKDNPLPWQPAQEKPTPERVLQGFGGLFREIGTPTAPPQTRGKSPGWPEGRPRTRPERHRVVKKDKRKPKPA